MKNYLYVHRLLGGKEGCWGTTAEKEKQTKLHNLDMCDHEIRMSEKVGLLNIWYLVARVMTLLTKANAMVKPSACATEYSYWFELYVISEATKSYMMKATLTVLVGLFQSP